MRWKVAVTAAAFAIPAVGLLGFGLTRDPGEIPSPLPGRPAPTFALPAFTSGGPTIAHPAPVPKVDSVNLQALRGQVVIVNFFASWCLACRDEHASLARVASQYVGSDVHFVGILYNDIPGNALKWLDEMGQLPYPSLADPGSRAAIDYGVYGIPETFFIGRDGKVAFKQVGAVTDEMLRARIDSLRAIPAGPVAVGGSAP
jgi:cytochrome c biogenesis protein CcmG/thiol:disulfide interchange protein DsbE